MIAATYSSVQLIIMIAATYSSVQLIIMIAATYSSVQFFGVHFRGFLCGEYGVETKARQAWSTDLTRAACAKCPRVLGLAHSCRAG